MSRATVIASVVTLALAGVLLLILILFVRSWLFHIGPVSSEEHWPYELKAALADDPREDRAQVRVYSLGGYVDSEYLWRMTATPQRLVTLIERWGLSRVAMDGVSDRFWRMPPNWWNPDIKSDVEFFASSDFVADQRGMDGEHYFVMYDKTQQLLYVWYKSNF